MIFLQSSSFFDIAIFSGNFYFSMGNCCPARSKTKLRINLCVDVATATSHFCGYIPPLFLNASYAWMALFKIVPTTISWQWWQCWGGPVDYCFLF